MAEGRMAEVFRWGDGKVLKLFRPEFPPSDADDEASIIRHVHAAGIPCPRAEAVVEVDGRRGIVLEAVEGPPMFAPMLQRPWTSRQWGRSLAQLHARVHAHTAPAEFASQRERLARKIRAASVPERIKGAALTALNALPEADAVCHGDFHPGNVLVSPRGLVIIDWIDATRGNPLGDVARTSLLTRVARPPVGPFVRGLITVLRALFLHAYLQEYARLRRVPSDEVAAWELPVAVARLEEDVPGERRRLLGIAGRWL